MIQEIIKNIIRIPLAKYFRVANIFEYQTKNLLETQEQVLLSKLRKNSETEYGKRYHFSEIKNPKEFQRNVPIITYDDISKDVERIKNGEQNILTSQNPIGFVTTSGTTDKPKFIPITKDFLDEYINSWNLWIFHMVSDHPKMPLGKVLSIVSPSLEGYTKSRIPYGAMTGLSLNHQSLISKMFYGVNPKIFSNENTFARQYTSLRISLEKNITMINTANPSTIKMICEMGNELKYSLIKDIHDGMIFSGISQENFTAPLILKPNRNISLARPDLLRLFFASIVYIDFLNPLV